MNKQEVLENLANIRWDYAKLEHKYEVLQEKYNKLYEENQRMHEKYGWASDVAKQFER